MQGTQTTAKEVCEAIGAYGTVNHGGAVYNWLQGYNIPTKPQYEAMRAFFNSRNCRTDYLRRDYEDLRREYGDLRRPFTVSAKVPYTDVFDFATVPAGPGKHLAEKPLPLLRHLSRYPAVQGIMCWIVAPEVSARLKQPNSVAGKGSGLSRMPTGGGMAKSG